LPMTALYETAAMYEDEETGTPITTRSMIKTFRASPREAWYKYVLRLKPKAIAKPLRRGTWLHALIEAHDTPGMDYLEVHEAYVREFRKLFDEERMELGYMPTEIMQLFKSYMWHYGDPAHREYSWKVHDTELKLTAQMPNGHLFRGVVDEVVEDDFGLWLVDHKTHKRLPDWNFRM